MVDHVNPDLTRAVMLFPILLLAIFIEYFFPIKTIHLFPIISSQFIKWNALVVIFAVSCLVLIKYRNVFPEYLALGLAYGLAVYLIYLIIILSTIVIQLNVFPDNMFVAGGKNKEYVMYMFFITNLLLVWFSIPLSKIGKWVCVFLYALSISLANFLYQTSIIQ